MTLIVAVSVPTGIVLSGDSRTTGTVTQHPPQSPAQALSQQDQPFTGAARQMQQRPMIHVPVVLSDATEKVFLLFNKFGVGVHGDAFINGMPIAHTIQQFEVANDTAKPATPEECAHALLEYFRAINPVPNVGMVLVGYDRLDQWVLGVEVPTGEVIRRNATTDTQEVTYTAAWGGDILIINRLLSDPHYYPPFAAMNLQDAVDLSRHLIRSTIDQMRFEPRFASVGGPIDTLVLSPSNTEFLAHKSLTVRD